MTPTGELAVYGFMRNGLYNYLKSVPPCDDQLPHQQIQALVTVTNQWKTKGGGVGKLKIQMVN